MEQYVARYINIYVYTIIHIYACHTMHGTNTRRITDGKLTEKKA